MSVLPGVLRYRCYAENCSNSYYSPVHKPEFKNKSFYRFPEKNCQRRFQWFSIMKLVPTNKRQYLCEEHFKNDQFCDTTRTRLKKFALPFLNTVTETINVISNIIVKPATPLMANYDNSVCIPGPSNIPAVENKEHYGVNNSCKRQSILSSINETRIKNLTPRKKKMYFINKAQRCALYKAKKSLTETKYKIKNIYKLVESEMFQNLDGKLDPVGISFIKSTFRNVKFSRPVWTVDDKIYALALFKKGPKCYNFLKRCIPLPSRSTLRKLLLQIPFDAGLNIELLGRLKKIIKNLRPLDRNCILMFDEIALSEQAILDKVNDKIVGYVDLGSLGRKNQFANQALVFMIHGLHKAWKQPIAFYFTRDTIRTPDLKYLIIEVISSLQSIGLEVLATVCDQGPTNRAAIEQLSNDKRDNIPSYYFTVNDKKIFTLFDPPHLLKSTRNAFVNYNIQFENTKIAKFQHIEQCFQIDRTKRFQALRKIREAYLNLDRYPRLKMKVCVAARTFSNTVAAAIETMIGNNLHAEAMHTAEFIHDIDSLFDSFNGSKPNADLGKTFRRCMSPKSPHLVLWNKLLPKIESWNFISKTGKGKKEKMPFKSGWIRTIKATKELWKVCNDKGFRFLRTRSLNQDPLENTFAAIRNYGASNVNPNCYQFVSSFKTSVLNNLIVPPSNKNCEMDNSSILDNLRTFLESDMAISLTNLDMNDLVTLELPTNHGNTSDHYDSATLTYVAGFLVRKLKKSDCDECCKNLTTETLEYHHTFTLFKEHSDKKKG